MVCCLTEKNDSMRSAQFLYFEGRKRMEKSSAVNEMTLAFFSAVQEIPER